MTSGKTNLQLAAKCMPDRKILGLVEAAGINAVEIYTNKSNINDTDIIPVCREFPFSYALHSPNDIVAPQRVFEIAKKINAKVVVTHDIYWEDEWPQVVKASEDAGIPLAIENIDGIQNFRKVLVRYKLKRCLDMEHLIAQMGGLIPGMLKLLIGETIHFHLTGYRSGDEIHHTHFYESPEQTIKILKCLLDCGYKGMVVSEATTKYQTRENFKRLKEFFDKSLDGMDKV